MGSKGVLETKTDRLTDRWSWYQTREPKGEENKIRLEMAV
jgi:hypothetical protein